MNDTLLLALFADGGEYGWMVGAAGLVVAVGAVVRQYLSDRTARKRDESNVKLTEWQELTDQQRVEIDRRTTAEGAARAEVERVRVATTAEVERVRTEHAAEMAELRENHAECERERAWLTARVDSLEYALEAAGIKFRRPPQPGPGSGPHRSLPPDSSPGGSHP